MGFEFTIPSAEPSSALTDAKVLNLSGPRYQHLQYGTIVLSLGILGRKGVSDIVFFLSHHFMDIFPIPVSILQNLNKHDNTVNKSHWLLKSWIDLYSFFFNTKCWNSLILQQLNVCTQSYLVTQRGKHGVALICVRFFFRGAVLSQHSWDLAVILGSTVLIFLLGKLTLFPRVFRVLVLLPRAAVSASPPCQAGKNVPFGNSPRSVNLILRSWLVWVVLRVFENRHL